MNTLVASSPSRIAAVAASLLVVIAPSAAAAADVVARIGGTDVNSDELRAYVDALGAQDRAAVTKDPALLSQLVRAYLARQVVLKEAQAKKWDQRPEVKAQLDRARDQALTELYLQSVSKPPETFPSGAELQAAYDANKKAFEVPKQYRVAQIFIAVARGVSKEAEEKAKAKLDEVLKKLKAKGVDFAAVARTDSDESAAAERGGEIGWLGEGQLIAGIRTTVTGLATGATSEPLRLDDGWHVIKVLETKPPSTRPLAEVRDALASQLRSDRAQANRQAYLAKLLEQNPPALNELALSKLVQK